MLGAGLHCVVHGECDMVRSWSKQRPMFLWARGANVGGGNAKRGVKSEIKEHFADLPTVKFVVGGGRQFNKAVRRVPSGARLAAARLAIWRRA